MTNLIVPQTPHATNVYLALGRWMGYPLMKVGKTINVANRQRELTLYIEFSCPCYTLAEGTEFEAEMREVMRRHGAPKFQNRYDWFQFHKFAYQCAVNYMLNTAPHSNVYQYAQPHDKNHLHELAQDFESQWRPGRNYRRAS